jgi:two-component system response regulator FlrC
MSHLEDFGRFQTANLRLKESIAHAHRLAPTLSPLLILGEAGVGKKEMALEIYSKSARKNLPLSFWRASDERPPGTGAITILVENIHEFSKAQQELVFRRLAQSMGDRALESPRFIFTGCKEILSLVRRGEVFSSLYHTLSERIIYVPNLTERREDLLKIAEDFVDGLNQVFGSQKMLTASVIAKLQYSKLERNWKELFDKIEFAYVHSEGPLLDVTDFGFDKILFTGDLAQSGMTLSDMEKQMIIQTLENTGQNRTKAAQILGISIRTLRNKLSQYKNLEQL